jgi:uncharacterized membrane protein HdeD (DUF308 family)
MTQAVALVGARLHLEKASGFSVWALILGALAVVAGSSAALGNFPGLVLPQFLLGIAAVIVGRKAIDWDYDQTLGTLGIGLALGSFVVTVLMSILVSI